MWYHSLREHVLFYVSVDSHKHKDSSSQFEVSIYVHYKKEHEWMNEKQEKWQNVTSVAFILHEHTLLDLLDF